MGQAGVSNVTAGVADGEALTEFSDASVDAVTCTWGLIFMPQWQKAVQVRRAVNLFKLPQSGTAVAGHKSRNSKVRYICNWLINANYLNYYPVRVEHAGYPLCCDCRVVRCSSFKVFTGVVRTSTLSVVRVFTQYAFVGCSRSGKAEKTK